MADLSITSANVAWSSGPQPVQVDAGFQSEPGAVVYLDATDSEYKGAIATAEASADAVGILVTDAEDGRKALIARNGATLNVGATTTEGVVYVVSGAAAGGIAPITDLTTDDYVTILFVGNGTATVTLNIVVSGQQVQ